VSCSKILRNDTYGLVNGDLLFRRSARYLIGQYLADFTHDMRVIDCTLVDRDQDITGF